MELKSAEKYITRVNEDTHLFQIPNSLMGISFDIARINFLSGPSPISIIWAGSCYQPALARYNTDPFYMSYNVCNRVVGNQNNLNGWLNYPPDLSRTIDVLYCDDAGKDSIFYFSQDNGTPPIRPNQAANISTNNKGVAVSKLTVYDKDYKYGAHVTIQASLEGFKQGEGPGQILMYYTNRTIPVANG